MEKHTPRRINQKSIYRILDVNLNRCREGLRVIEDISRFYYNREKDYRKVRNVRHRLDKTFRKMYPRLLIARRVRDDFGLKLKEKKRKDIREILIASFRRIEESLRVLEEFVRLVSQDEGKKLKNIRYALYNLEKSILNGRI